MKRAFRHFVFAFTLMGVPLSAFSASVSYEGVCYSSEAAAYDAFVLSWPRIVGTTTGSVLSLNTHSLSGATITFSIRDGGGGVSVNRNIYLSPCAGAAVSLGGYPVQNILIGAAMVFALLLGFGHGTCFTRVRT